MYIEDSKFLAKTTASAIESIFGKFIMAYDGMDGYEKFIQHRREIDIIITDLIMPQLDGASLIKKLRSNGYDVPIIVTTGFDDFLKREKLVELSIDAFLIKPVNSFKLLKSINKTVDNLLTKRELVSKKEMIEKSTIYSETDTKGLITYVSHPFEKISGYSKAELIGKSHALLKHHETPSSLYEEMWADLKNFKPWHGEITNRAKDGSDYTISINIAPLYYKDNLIGYSSTSIDMTALKLATRELQLKTKQAAMGEMVAMIAHQWRQPITSIGLIIANLEFDLIMGEIEKQNLQEGFDNIKSHVHYLSNTIDIFRNLLSHSQRKKKVTMNDVMQETFNIVKTQCEQNTISLEVQPLDCTIEFYTHQEELSQAVINIVTNSIEALLENEIQKPKIEIFCTLDSSFLTIHIQDNAGGIKPEIISKIFTPYFSTKKAKNGTGLGLYMTKMIIEDHLDGTISVDNNEEGVIFSIKLPRNEL